MQKQKKFHIKNLDDDQRKKLDDLKSSLPSAYDDHHYNEIRLTRFLTAHYWDPVKTKAAIMEDMQWRQDKKLDTILEWFPESPYFESLIAYFPSGNHGVDKRGIPVYIERIGSVNPQSLVDIVPKEDLLNLHYYTMELSEKERDEALEKLADPAGGIVDPGGVIYLEDMSGFSISTHFYAPAIPIALEALKGDETHYPGILQKMFIANPPMILSMCFNLISTVLDKRTTDQISILGSEGITEIERYVDPSSIPKYLGGSCSCDRCIPPGGIYTGRNPNGTTATFLKQTIPAKSTFEIRIECHGHQIMNWKFSIAGHDIGFVVRWEDADGTRDVWTYAKYGKDGEEERGKDLVAENRGTFILHWDNTYSHFRSKEISYHVTLREQEDAHDLD
eukprot:TRINITY_DN22135_c0_g1_i1.p1 TRINITY_DN22135_c0_g1~~TRINITY_DN22135_c0_g1_i1.p1  ORF type:complete len:391 (-),score=90.24 TRINITY_DN22135_c0_g1_i1:13-1185(-)